MILNHFYNLVVVGMTITNLKQGGIMEKQAVYVVYEGDQWLSTSSLEVKAVCSSWDSMIDVVVNIAGYNGMSFLDSLPEDYDGDCIEDVTREFEATRQYLGDGFGITFEVFDMDTVPYNV